MIFKETEVKMMLMGNVPIATAFFQHLPKISAFSTVLRAFEFKFVEANIGIRLHLSLLVQPANFHISLPHKITFHWLIFLNHPWRFKLKNKGPDKIAYFLLYILSMWSGFVLQPEKNRGSHTPSVSGRFPREGVLRCACEQFIPRP